MAGGGAVGLLQALLSTDNDTRSKAEVRSIKIQDLLFQLELVVNIICLAFIIENLPAGEL